MPSCPSLLTGYNAVRALASEESFMNGVAFGEINDRSRNDRPTSSRQTPGQRAPGVDRFYASIRKQLRKRSEQVGRRESALPAG